MIEYIENLNKTYKSGQFSLDEDGTIVVSVVKIRSYEAMLTEKQCDWIRTFCSRVSNNCMRHMSKHLASAVIDFHLTFPDVKIYLRWA